MQRALYIIDRLGRLRRVSAACTSRLTSQWMWLQDKRDSNSASLFLPSSAFTYPASKLVVCSFLHPQGPPGEDCGSSEELFQGDSCNVLSATVRSSTPQICRCKLMYGINLIIIKCNVMTLGFGLTIVEACRREGNT